MSERPTPPGREPTAIERFERGEITSRETLLRERGEAVEKKAWATGWLMIFGFGPAAALSIALALAAGRPDLIWPFVGLGATVQILRIWREKRRIQRIEEELGDPMDGS
jgi:hypothetical protein